jgi:hypothetical protein
MMAALPMAAQSTFGIILGSVRDSSGALVPGAQLTLINKGTMAQRKEITDESGNYSFYNVEVGLYALNISSTGFQTATLPEIALTARETRRMDATIKPGAETQTVVVLDEPVPVITTDASNLAETKLGTELVDLPVAIYSRSTGSTSPISTLTTEAGVQTDDSGNLAVMGTTAALLSVTVDGISSVGVEYSGPVNEMFPSFNSIEEIRVSESNNSAEFGGVADITTISKAGTNRFHGGLFENHENTIFNSGVPVAFASAKPKIIMNDFGGTLGGPLEIPRLYNGRDKSFFFISYEGLRLPRETPIVLSVPSLDMRNGNLTDYLTAEGVSAIYQPDGVTSINPANVPVSAISASLLKYLVPNPNYGPGNSFTNNYQVNFPSPISSNQGDVRLDQVISEKQSVFARFSYKNRQVTTAPSAQCTFTYCAEAGSPLQGGYNTPEIDEGLTFAYNYIFNARLLNEFRGGFNAQHTSETQSYSTNSLLAETGIDVPQPDAQWSEAPQVLINNGMMSTGAGNPGVQRGQIVEVLDNLTWTSQKHTFKFGGDLKRMTDHDDNVYGNYRSGWYVFDGSSSVGTAIGDTYTSFLLGYPDYTMVSTTKNPTMNGLGYAYGVYGQDDWKIKPNLTLNIGLRYELHPPIKDTGYNTAFFLPNYVGPGTDGSTAYGAVAVPNTKAESFESSDFETAISPTPTLTASQAGIPSGLRFTDKTDWGPRLGFAWRVYGNDKTVLRGGWGRYIESPLGFALVAGWGVDASYEGTYYQDYQSDGVTPLLSFATPFSSAAAGSTTGTAGFYYAFPVHYKDPSVQQWNLTLEQDLTHNMGMRLSYTGSRGANLETMEDLNQVHPNTIGYNNPANSAPSNSTAGCIADNGTTSPYLVSDLRPYPCFSIVQSVANAAESNYNSGTVEVSRHSGKGITFDASYIWTRDLSNAGGATPNAFAVAGGSYLTDRFHPGLDYGNVIYDRKHRFLATYLYDLPFGKGKLWMHHSSLADKAVGGWQLAGVTILQSGPFLTPYETSTDPAGTNILTTVGQTRSDLQPGRRVYSSSRTASAWLQAPCPNQSGVDQCGSAFSVPANNRGYFGTAGVGSIVGPGTSNFSLSLMKNLSLSDNSRFQFGLEAANVLNHRNYEPPNMQVDAAGFGQISALQTAEGAGPRSLELSGRINF